MDVGVNPKTLVFLESRAKADVVADNGVKVANDEVLDQGSDFAGNCNFFEHFSVDISLFGGAAT